MLRTNYIWYLIDTNMVQKLWDKMQLNNNELTPKELHTLLSVNLTEDEADLFNDGCWTYIPKIVNLIEIYDQTGIILEPLE